jgi:hypothetical protein
MKYLLRALFAASITLLNACAVFNPVTINPGESEPEVIAKLGEPTNRYNDGNDRLLEYSSGPWGQTTHMARFGPDRRLKSYEQVLTTQKFSTLKEGVATKAEVLRTIGAPTETSYLSLTDLEVWSYSYKESGAWNSMMHVHFDRQGVVRKMLNGPDPKFDPDRRFPFGFMLR